ncbi:serine hydrolase family protein [Candidatus Woesearchaeota archaeon]|nr:serine hydrolase family protein [Candidatus Woesearchaeota archaeon]
MTNAIIIHGSYGNPAENWFPWLKEALKKIDIKTFVPEFPTPKNQNLEAWNDTFKDYEKYLNQDSILIGHSIGCPFILSVLENTSIQIKASFLVAGFLGPIGNDYFDIINKTFTEKNFDLEKINKNCKNFFSYHSDNDPYIPLGKGKEFSEKIGAELKIISNAGHFNESSGYKKFEILLQDIKKTLAKHL